MKRKSKNYRLILNHTATKKRPDSESSEEEYCIRPPQSHNRRRARKQKSSTKEEIVYRNEYSHGESTTYLTPSQSDDHTYHSNSSSRPRSVQNSLPHYNHKKKNVKISVRPLRQKALGRQVVSDTCHKGIESRGYHPFTEPEFKSTAKSPCFSTEEHSFCRDHIYKPVKGQNHKFDDDFINSFDKRCEEDKKYACGLNGRNASDYRQNQRPGENFCYEPKEHFCCDKNHKEQQTECNEDSCFKRSIRHHEIKLIAAGKKSAADYNIIVRDTKEKMKESCKEETHLFPFQKTANGLLKINSSMICYQDGKMCLLVADHSKTKIQFKSMLSSKDQKEKSKHCSQNEKLLTKKCQERCPSLIVESPKNKWQSNEIPVRDSHCIRERYENIHKKIIVTR